MARTAQRRRPAAAPVTPAGEVAPKAPCPCGSGRKYKHCHGSGYATERYPLTVTVPAGVVDGARFSFHLTHPSGLGAQVEVHVAVL